MLYAGIKDDRVIVLHNTWGVKTMHEGKEGRDIVGKAIISDLYLGENNPHVDKKSQLIAKVQGISIITPSDTHPLLKAYAASIHSISNNHVLFHDGTLLPYDDKRQKVVKKKSKMQI